MAQKKLDDKLKIVSFLTDDQLVPIVDKLFESVPEGKHETFQVQINTKGYENRKDPKMTKEVKFPNIMRKNPDVCCIGDDSIREAAEKLGLPFALTAEYEGKGEEKVKMRKKFIKKYSYFLTSAKFYRAFPLQEIMRKKKVHFVYQNAADLPNVYEKCLYTYKLRIRDWNSISFPAGHSNLTKEEVVDKFKCINSVCCRQLEERAIEY